jgi:hypothetical protein
VEVGPFLSVRVPFHRLGLARPVNFAAVQLWAAAISSGEGEVAEARREAVTHKTAAPANEDSTFVRRDIDRFSSG